jgi:hypothetical protein
MSNAARWAVSAENKFREVARTATNPSTTLLAEGLAHLAEAVRALDDDVQQARTEIKSMRQSSAAG